jgi:hypothetical protein
MSRNKTSDICFGFLRMILLTGGAWPQNAAAPAEFGFGYLAGLRKMIPIRSSSLFADLAQVNPSRLVKLPSFSRDTPHLQSSAARSKRNENVTLTSPVGTADLDNVFESRMKGSARIN